MLAALLLDLDGTLVDTNALHARAFADALAEGGIVVPPAALLPHIGLGANRLVRALLGPTVPDGQAEALAARHTDLYLARYADRATLRAGALALLTAARERGLRIALATASKQDELDAVARAAGLDLDAFDAVLTAEDVDEAKPDPDVVTTAAERLGVSVAATALVGDTPFDGMAAGRAGSVLLGVENGTHTVDELRRRGARGVWPGPGDLVRALDRALDVASPGPHVLTDERLGEWMEMALAEADAGLDAGGLPFGAVVVRSDGTVLARASNRRHATGATVDHAEIEALRGAGRALDGVRDALLVTTVEPCALCLGAAVEARIDTVVFARAAPDNGGRAVVSPRPDGATAFPRVVPLPAFEARVRAQFARALAAAPDDTFLRRLAAA